MPALLARSPADKSHLTLYKGRVKLFPALVLTLSLWSSALPAAEIRTLSGTGAAGFMGDGSSAQSAQVNDPTGLCRTAKGVIYFCDTANHRIRMISPEGLVSTIAGTGAKGYAGDGGPALQAQLNEPYEVRVDSAGNLFFVERLNHTVRRVDGATQTISTVAGNGSAGFSGDGGPATAAQLKEPHSIGLDPAGNLYICDTLNHRVRKVDAQSQVITTIAGTGAKAKVQDSGAFADSPLSGPRALDFDAQGNLWLALREGNAVYKLDLRAGTIHHFAGTGKQGFAGNGGPAKEALLAGPKGLSVGPDGNVYLADTESHSIRMVNVQTGKLELIAGTGKKGDGPDGDPLHCQMNRPHGVFVDRTGILIGDSSANRVRQITR